MALFLWKEFHGDAGTAQEVGTVRQAVLPAVDNALDACLYDEFGTLYAGRVGDVEGGTVRIVARACNLGDGIGFGMKHIGVGDVVVVLAHVGETAWRTVVAVGYYHLVLHYECAHLPALAVTVLTPDGGHAQIAAVKDCVLCLCHIFGV